MGAGVTCPTCGRSQPTHAQEGIQAARALIGLTVVEWYKGKVSDQELLNLLRAHCADLEIATTHRLTEMMNDMRADFL